jgi:hypothetical protein
MVFSFSLGSGRDHRGLTASQESRLSPGRSEPVKRKAEGFRTAESGLGSLNGPAAALSVPVGRLRVRMDWREEKGLPTPH